MYSPQLLRVHQDECLRSAETRRLIKQAADSGRNVATASHGSVLGRVAIALRPRNAAPTSTPAP
jgi:hypothetical protein